MGAAVPIDDAHRTRTDHRRVEMSSADNLSGAPEGASPVGLAGLDAVFLHPEEVLADRRMTDEQKRGLLASWASDAHALECAPTLRQLESGAVVRLDDVLAALKTLDAGLETPKARSPDRRRGRAKILRLRLTPRWARPTGPDDDDDDPPPAAALRQTLLAA
jgi:hypothetical protein